jgi:hypothetical protein
MSKSKSTMAIPEEKPLNQSQIKNLRELVHGDFQDLHIQVEDEIERRLKARLDEIEEKFSKTESLEAAQERLRQAGREAEDRLRSLVSELTKGDIEVETTRYNKSIVAVEVDVDLLVQKGRGQAENKANAAASRLKTTAYRLLAREQRGIERTVLLQGITSGSAQQILDDMPASEDVMTLIAGEMQMVSEDDIKALITEAEIEQSKALGN